MLAVTSSMHDVYALYGLLHPLCMIYRRRVGCYILYACFTGVMCAVTASMYDVQSLCGLLHPLTLSLTIIKVHCRAQNPNPTTVAATFLDTALSTGNHDREPRRNQDGTKTGNKDGEPRRGTKTGNKDGGNKDGEQRRGIKTKNRERRIRTDKDGEKRVYAASAF